MLRYYDEPSWNNPVVRIVNDRREDVASSNYSQLGVVQTITTALRLQGASVPTYLQLLQEELQARHSGVEQTVLSLFCFWTGEIALANKIKGDPRGT